MSEFKYSLTNLKPVESSKIALTFPDGARREFPKDTTGLDIAKSISPSLAKRTVAMALDGVVGDLADPIGQDANIEFIARDDARALELIRHDAAHVLAEAVQTLWPGTQVTIGPVIENGFYYDFFRNEPFTPEDFAAIEKKMREIIARDKPFTRQVWSREQTKQVFRDKGENFKVELVDAIPGDEPIKIYFQGDWFDLCRGPHMTSTGKIGNAFKLMKVAGAYWRGDSNNPMLTRIYGTAFAKQEELDAYLRQIEEAEKRDHRKLGRELDLFHFQEEGPGVVFWHPKGWTVFQALIAYMRRRLAVDYSEVNAPQILDKALWEIGIDVVKERMQLALDLKLCDEVLESGPDNVAEVRRLTGGMGVERAVDCSANDQARATAIRATRKWGRIVFLGEGGRVEFNPSPDIIHDQKTIYGSWVTSTWLMEELVERLVRWNLHPADLVTHRFLAGQRGPGLYPDGLRQVRQSRRLLRRRTVVASPYPFDKPAVQALA